jgi:transmembrane sensor
VAIYGKCIKVTREQIDKFFKGQSSNLEAEEFMKWMESAQNEQNLIEHLQKEWDDSLFSDQHYDEFEVLKKINHIIDEKYPLIHNSTRKRTLSFKSWHKYAAVILIVVSISVLLIPLDQGQKADLQASENVSFTRSTEPGQKLKFQLPDRSMITLNADSKLEYIENDSLRVVSLSGEGFFEVAKNEEKPFVVNAGKLKASVIGTSFNISSREGMNETSIALVDGRLKVELSDLQDIMLIPGEQAILDQGANVLKKDTWDYFQVFGWKEGVLLFKDAFFPDIINQLELWYGVKIELNENKVLKKHYSGRFNNEPLSNVLESFSFIYNFKYEINKKEVSIKFNSDE